MTDTTMPRFSLEQAGLVTAAIIGLLPGLYALLGDHVFGGEAALGLLLTFFAIAQLLRGKG